jgi:hypothetical protein
MFVQADLPLALPFDAAASALDRAMADGGLVGESRRAMTDGLEFVMPVGPRGSRFPARDVVVRLLPARRLGQRLVVDLRWETTGPTGRLFPALDAILELAAGEDPNLSRLSIIGRYQPPLATVGQTLNSMVMSRVASATMNAMLREVATQIAAADRESAGQDRNRNP